MSELTAQESQNKQDALKGVIMVPEPFKGWLADFGARVATDFLVQHSQGFRESRFVSATVDASETCPNTSDWGDIATVGPILEHLSDGTYMFIFGFFSDTGSGNPDDRSAVLKINGSLEAVPTDNEAVTRQIGNAWRVAQFSISNDNDNEVKMVYKVTTSGRTFEHRFLHAVKINPI